MTVQTMLAVAVGTALWAHAAAAQTVPDGAVEQFEARHVDAVSGLDLDGAVARALAEEPSLEAVRHELAAARGSRIEAGLRPNPMVGLAHQAEPGGVDRQTRVEVSWPLDLFRRRGRVAVAEHQTIAARHALSDRQRRLAADVRVQYGLLAAAIRELAVLDMLSDAVARQLALVSARVQDGAAPQLERDLLRVELLRLEAERPIRTGIVETSAIELQRLLGLAPDAAVRISETLEDLVNREARSTLPGGDGMAQDRPDVAEVRARMGAAEADVERARRDGRFDVILTGMYMRMDAGFPQRAFGPGGALEPVRGRFHYFGAGALVSVPLSDRNQGEEAAARARQSAAAAQLEAARLGARAEIAAATARDAQAQRALAAYASEARQLARKNLDVVYQTYALGRATMFDVLSEQRRYLEVERAFTETLSEAFQARQALRRATGAVQ